MWRPLLYISVLLPSSVTETMTSESLDQLSAVQTRISELRGYL